MEPIVFTPKMMVDLNIDGRCQKLVRYFNSIGLRTKFCCEGHPTDIPSEDIQFYIIFDDELPDSEIKEFIYDLEKFCWTHQYCILWTFNKWTRYMPNDDCGVVVSSWTFEISGQTHESIYRLVEATEDIFTAFEADKAAHEACEKIDKIDDDFESEAKL